MDRARHPKMCWAVVLVLLLFSAADLLGDIGGFALCPADSDVELHDYLPLDGQEELPAQPDGEQHHIDDCFCCSHCIQHSSRFVLVPGEFVSLVDPVLPILELPLLPRELFRPPRAS